MKTKWLIPALAACAMQAFALEIKLPDETTMYPANANPAYITTLQKCIICHSADYVFYQPNLSKSDWNKITDKMRVSFKAPVTEEEAAQIAGYLFDIQSKER